MAAYPNKRTPFLALMEPFALMPAGAAKKACATIIVLVSRGNCDLGIICIKFMFSRVLLFPKEIVEHVHPIVRSLIFLSKGISALFAND